MKKVIMRIVVILLCAFLLAFPAYGSTTQPTTIYSCDSLPATMSQGEIVTDFGLGNKALYSDVCIRSTGNVILNANFANCVRRRESAC